MASAGAGDAATYSLGHAQLQIGISALDIEVFAKPGLADIVSLIVTPRAGVAQRRFER